MSRLCIAYVYGVKVNIDYDYSKGHPAVMYLSNGDPGYPAEPAEVVMNEISIGEDDQNVIDHLDQSFLNKCEEKCYEDADADDGDYDKSPRED